MILSTLILLLPCREIPYLSEYMSNPCDDCPRAVEVIVCFLVTGTVQYMHDTFTCMHHEVVSLHSHPQPLCHTEHQH